MPVRFLPAKPTRPTFQVSTPGGQSSQTMSLSTPKISSSSLSSSR
jgi:hypothetical protein